MNTSYSVSYPVDDGAGTIRPERSKLYVKLSGVDGASAAIAATSVMPRSNTTATDARRNPIRWTSGQLAALLAWYDNGNGECPAETD